MTDPHRLLERDDIIDGLRALIIELHARHTPARIRIVGGAAIALTVHADRAATVDIDAPLEPAQPVLDAAPAIAARRGWRTDWLNDAAGVFSMKLHAANRRGNRDAPDLAVLLPTCRITTVHAAAELYEAFYPGDSLTVRTEGLVAALLDNGAPAPASPTVPPLDR